MAHKTVILKRGFPYTSTSVPFQRSVQQIMDMLAKYKCHRVALLKDTEGKEEKTTMVFEKMGATYLLEFPITYFEDSKGKRLNMNISGRIVHDRIKAILLMVEVGYLDFAQAMMAFRAIPNANGTMVPLQDAYERCGDALPASGFDLRLALSDGGGHGGR